MSVLVFGGSLIAAVTFGVACRAQWRQYTAPDAAFAVALPADAVTWSESVDSGWGRVTVHLLKATTRWSWEVGFCLVSYQDLPPRSLQAEAVLNESRDQIIRRFRLKGGTEITDVMSSTIDGHATLDFGVRGAAGLRLRARTLLVGTRVYQLVVGGELAEHSAERFFGSFTARDDLPRASGGGR